MKKFALIFPGQGAQYLAMGRDFYQNFQEAKEVFQEAEDVLNISLTDLIFDGSEEELTLTKNSQIAIFVVSYAIWKVIQKQFPEITPDVCAGLSLGEYTALVAAGKMSFADGVRLVAERGRLMHEASVNFPGTMAVVLGMDVEEVKRHLPEGVWIANLNCPGQVVISGTKEGIENAAVTLKEAGAKRVLPLSVSGAFHSPLMGYAKERLAPMIDGITLVNSDTKVVMNVSGGFVSDLQEMKELLKRQVVEPTFWEKGIRFLDSQGIDIYLEIGPGKTLTGMNKKIGTAATTLNIETVEDLKKLEELNATAC